MRIGIDARFYGPVGKGLGRYTSELISQLELLDHDNEYVIFLRKSNFDEYVPKNPKFTKVLAEYPWYSWQEQILYPGFLAKYKLDLIHFAHFNVPLFYGCPFVVTIHDLILLDFPTPRATTLGPLLYRLKYLMYRLVIGRAIRAAAAVITVSHYTKKRILETFPAAKNKTIAVTYEACARRFRTKSTAAATRIPQGPFALYVGNAYPHKNLERLLHAFSKFRAQHQDYSLVLVGNRDYFYERLEAEAKAKKLDNHVIFYGHATDDELEALYGAAKFYVFPSLCEGFGLPPLEAMCANLPVASSNACSMPEILGDAALHFDPTDAGAIATAMSRLADDNMLRANLIEKGKQRAATFSWETCGRETLEIYRSATR